MNLSDKSCRVLWYVGQGIWMSLYQKSKGNNGDLFGAVIAMSWQDGLHRGANAVHQQLDD